MNRHLEGCLSPFFYCYNKIVEAGNCIQKKGLLDLQFWRLRVQGREDPSVWPLVRVSAYITTGWMASQWESVREEERSHGETEATE
jgi:hypothetical protein